MADHNLGPKRPWKAELLGDGCGLSCQPECRGTDVVDGVIAVSGAELEAMAARRPTVDHSGIGLLITDLDTESGVEIRSGSW